MNKNEIRGELGINFALLEDNILKNSNLNDMFELEDIKDRKLYINDDIEAYLAKEICYHIMRYNRLDKGIEVKDRTPITIYLNSCGGDVSSGLSICDMINCSQTPIHIVNMGNALSMGAIIFTCGHIRYSMPNASIMYHSGSCGLFNTSDKVKDTIEHQSKVDEKIKSMIIEKTQITKKLYNQKDRVEWYLSADEGKKLGVIDKIIGIDCNVNEVV